MSEQDEYADLAAAAEAGRLESIPGGAVRGAQAAAAGRALLMAATGASTIEQATRLAVGRPRLGEERRPSAVWKVRASAELDDLATEHAGRTGMTMSDLVRTAVHEYVTAHA